MSITLGIYDLFSYLVPGMLYLYLLNETAKVFAIDIIKHLMDRFPETIVIILGLVLAFVVGHIFDLIARWLVFRLIFRKKTSQQVLDEIKRKNPELDIQFEAKDWHLLLILLRQRNFEVAQTFDKHEADSIMFRNICLISLLAAFLVSYHAFIANPLLWVLTAVAMIAFVMSAKRSYTLHKWFFEGIFFASLEYGNTISAILKFSERRDLDHVVRFSLSNKK